MVEFVFFFYSFKQFGRAWNVNRNGNLNNNTVSNDTNNGVRPDSFKTEDYITKVYNVKIIGNKYYTILTYVRKILYHR